MILVHSLGPRIGRCLLNRGQYAGAVAEVSEPVRQRLVELGREGSQWLRSLDGRVAELERIWECEIGEAMCGGSAAFVARAVDRSGRAAVVKIAIPAGGTGYSGFERELDVLTFAGPTSYVSVFDHSIEHRALLMERLGPPLAECGLDVENPDRRPGGDHLRRMASGQHEPDPTDWHRTT